MKSITLIPFGHGSAGGEEISIPHGQYTFRLYPAEPHDLEEIAQRLKIQAEKAHDRPLGQGIEALGQVASLWSNPHYPPRQEALEVLPAITGLPASMVEQELAELCRLLQPDALFRWLEQELGGLEILESWTEGGAFWMHRQPRGLILHNLSGNAFLLPALSAIFGLLTKNATLIKLATAEPYFGIRFAESIRDANPEIAADIAVLYWSAQREDCYRALFQQGLGAVVAWGDMRSVAALSRLAGQYRTHFIDHGARFGIAVIDKVMHQDLPALVRDLAEDIVPWEGYACISPPLIFSIEGEVSALKFAHSLLLAMEDRRARSDLPLDIPRESSRISAREFYFFQLEAEGRGKVLTSEGGGATVIYSRSIPSREDLMRCAGLMVMVCPARDWKEVCTALTRDGLGSLCQALALHGSGSEMLDHLTLTGISHITRPGRMNHKEVGFSHDGILNLQALTRLVTRSRT